ncbi:MAG: DUF4178 domain-containing protein [Nitrospirae bacterium]|nr:MAG: DUF4178 domain-containing protein [Nitrospirota bacterium]
MRWNFFGKKKKDEDEFDPLLDVELKNLEVGWFVDFDMKTWEVKAHHKYDWGDGYITDEWELRSGRKVIFLHYDPEDGGLFTISEKIPIGQIEGNIREYIKTHEDGPDRIVYKGTTYYLEEDGGALFIENGEGVPVEFIYWDYVDDSGNRFVSIEQWGDNEFEAYAGKIVEEFEFDNILPRST